MRLGLGLGVGLGSGKLAKMMKLVFYRNWET